MVQTPEMGLHRRLTHLIKQIDFILGNTYSQNDEAFFTIDTDTDWSRTNDGSDGEFARGVR